MDDRKFDALTRTFAQGTSRRGALKGMLGALIGGAAVATGLDRVGAQRTCKPETLVTDCPLPDTCTTATCELSDGTYYCVYQTCPNGICCNGVCQSECCVNSDCAGGVCCGGVCHEQCCVDSDCVAADAVCSRAACVNGICTAVPGCTQGERCCGQGTETAHCAAQCCGDGDCTASPCGWCGGDGHCHYHECCAARSCPTACHSCDNGSCRNWCGPEDTCCVSSTVTECVHRGMCCPDCVVEECELNGTCCRESGASCAVFGAPGTPGTCCDDLLCCAGGEGGYCAECCGDSDCGPCSSCSDGVCYGECNQSERCCDGQCVEDEECCKGPDDLCGLLEVTGADGNLQVDCCDGLVCCDQWGDMGPTCAQCCTDWDCPKGAWCNRGWCEWPEEECEHDKDCPKGTCCCKDGTCSGKCCHQPRPPKPAPSGGSVTSLPATGAGPSDERNGLLGATALGAAAALYAARKMRETPEASTEK